VKFNVLFIRGGIYATPNNTHTNWALAQT